MLEDLRASYAVKMTETNSNSIVTKETIENEFKDLKIKIENGKEFLSIYFTIVFSTW